MKFCSQPWHTVRIIAGGDVRLCFCDAWNTVDTVGNCLEDSLADILNNQAVAQFRDEIRAGRYDRCTTVCPHKWSSVGYQTQEQLPNQPTRVLLALEQECNLRCESCRDRSIFTGRVNPEVSRILTQVKEFYQHSERPVYLQCDGMGDVFASRAYRDFLGGDVPECFRLDIMTNGLLIIKNQDLLIRLAPQIHSIQVSVDAARADTYQRIRGGSWSVLEQGLYWMRSRGFSVNVSMVVQRHNWREMMEFWNRASDWGASHVNYQLIRRWPHMTNKWWRENSLDLLTAEEHREFRDMAQRILRDRPQHITPGAMPPVDMDGSMLAELDLPSLGN